MINIILQLLLIFIIPGFVTLYMFEIRQTHKKQINFFEFSFISIIVSICITTLLGIILLLFNIFILWLLWLLITIYSVIVLLIIMYFIIKNKFERLHFVAFKKEYLIVLILVITAFIVFAKPFNPLISYDDGHMNMTIGATILENKQANYIDQDLLSISPEYRHFFGTGFTGLNSWETDEGIVETSYYRLTHIWVAIVYGITNNTLDTAFLFIVLGVLSVISVFYSTKHFFNLKIAIISTSLLIFSFPQIWFSRYPGNTEIPFQFLLFAGLFLFSLFLKRKVAFFGIFSAIAFGLLFFTRIDSVLIIPAIFGYLLYIYLFEKNVKHQAVMNITLIIMFLFSVLFNWVTAERYTKIYFETIPVVEFSIILILSLLIILIVYFFRNNNTLSKIKEHLTKHYEIYVNIFITLTCIALFYLFITSSDQIYLRNQGNRFLMSEYITIPIMFIGIFSLIFALKKEKWKAMFIILIFLVFTLFYLESLHNRNVHPWAMRRYIMVTIPMIYIGYGYFSMKISKFFNKKYIALLMFILAFFLTFNISANLLTFNELDGTDKKIISTFDEFSDKDIIINLDWSNHRLLYPAKFTDNKKIFSLSRYIKKQENIYNEPEIFNNFSLMIDEQIKNNETVYLLNPDTDMIDKLSGSFELTKYKQKIITYPHWPRTIGKFTNTYTEVSVKLTLYQIEK